MVFWLITVILMQRRTLTITKMRVSSGEITTFWGEAALFHSRDNLLKRKTAELFCKPVKCGICIQPKTIRYFV